jgi:hypothetical protein
MQGSLLDSTMENVDHRALFAEEANKAKWKEWPDFCQMEMDDSNTKSIPVSHLWLWYILGVLLYCCWLIGVKHVQHTTQQRLNSSKAFAASNFCVRLSNLNGTKGDNAKLEEYGRQYGDVRLAFHVRTLGRVVHICKMVCLQPSFMHSRMLPLCCVPHWPFLLRGVLLDCRTTCPGRGSPCAL